MTAAQMTERLVGTPVAGGSLRGAIWNESGAGDPVLAIHGITASHTSFHRFAELLGAPVLALDLRGRGRSRDLPGPFELEQHARDMAKALEYLGWNGIRVVGHSMGAFVGVRLAARRHDLVRELTLVDGGLPLLMGPATPEDVLGPAVQRLRMRFPTLDAYREFWRAHPAFGPYWNAQIERYVDYDLVPVEGGFSPAANPDAVAVNMAELDGRGGYVEALESLRSPFTLFTSPRGLLDETPGLYSSESLQHWSARLPAMTVIELPGTNHYTVVLSEAVSAVVDKLKEEP